MRRTKYHRGSSTLLTSVLGLLAVAWGETGCADQWKFLVYSDSNGYLDQLPAFATQTVQENPAFVLFPGDLSSSGSPSAFDAWRSAMAPVYQHGIPVCAVTGNHDAYNSQTGLDAFKSALITPLATNPFSGCRDFTVSTDPAENRSYSFNYRSATFLGLDTHADSDYRYDRVNQAFVNQQLARSNVVDSPLLFSFWHEPAFRASTDGIGCLSNYPTERNALWQGLENAGCQAVFNGHYHLFADARMDNGDGNPDNDIHQIVVGSCSYSYDYGYNGNMGPWTVVPVASETGRHGYVRVVVDESAKTVTQTWVRQTAGSAFQDTPYTWTYSFAPPPAVTWNGSGADNNWATAANWGGTVPKASSTLVFSGANPSAANNNLPAGTLVYGLTFAADAGAFTLDGNSIRLTGSIVNHSSSDQTINLPIMLGRNCTIDVGSQNMVVARVLSGDAGGLTKAGRGTLTLNAANTYAGPTTVSDGTLALSHSLALQQSTLDTSGAGTLIFAGLSAATVGGLTGSGTLRLADTASNGVALIVGNNGASTTYSGVLGGPGSLTKIGSGRLSLFGANTYLGPTAVNAGSLFVHGTQNGGGLCTVASGATLGGTGTITGGVSLDAAAHLAPGFGPATLTLGSLSMNGGSLLDFDLGQPGIVGQGVNDLITVQGSVLLDGILSINALEHLEPGPYTLLTYGGTASYRSLRIGDLPVFNCPSEVSQGTYARSNMVLGSAPYAYVLEFAPNGSGGENINLIVASVPEPLTIVLLGTGALGLLLYTWRRSDRRADPSNAGQGEQSDQT